MAHWIIKSKKIVDIEIELPTECSDCNFSEYKAERYRYCPMCGKPMTEESRTKVLTTILPT